MKTYLNELRGQVRGNARLRRRLDAARRRERLMRTLAKGVVSLCDGLGHGDAPAVRMMAAEIGWVRDSVAAQKYREAMK